MKNFRIQFGGKITPELKAKYEQSENWKNGMFRNLEKTDMVTGPLQIGRIIYKQLTYGKEGEPTQPLPVLPFDKNSFLAPSEKAKFIWYGHSVVFMRMNEQTLLIDPMLGGNTTPIAPIANKRFSENTLQLIDGFPEIDLLLLTHDHYDHLDFDSIQKLKHKTQKYFVALGIKRHLVRWGVAPDLITEFDWWDNQSFENINITFTPTRHFSGRGLTDRNKSLWGGWAFENKNENIWFSGDGGYGQHFKEVGKRLGPFDFGFMECGQYNEEWRPIHLFPNESVQAAIDAGAKKIMPVHWAGFNLSFQHTWYEPGNDFAKFATKKNIDFILPSLGMLFNTTNDFKEKWWEAFL